MKIAAEFIKYSIAGFAAAATPPGCPRRLGPTHASPETNGFLGRFVQLCLQF